MITYKEFDTSLLEDVKEIYRSVYWQTYLQDDDQVNGMVKNITRHM